MTKTDQEKMDEVLARMLKTPPKPHAPIGKQGQPEGQPRRSRKKQDD